MVRRNRHRAGFSLLEVMVAFVVLALSLSALLPALTTLSHRSRSAEDRWLAGELALSQLDMVGVTAPLASGEESGEWRNWRWEVQIRPISAAIPESARFATLFEITVKVSDSRSGAVLVQLTTVKRAPGAGR